jgi:hypothetical protein
MPETELQRVEDDFVVVRNGIETLSPYDSPKQDDHDGYNDDLVGIVDMGR